MNGLGKKWNKNFKVDSWISNTMLVVVMYCYTILSNFIIKCLIYLLYIKGRGTAYLERQLIVVNLAIKSKRINLLGT